MNEEQPANTAAAQPVAKKPASPFVTDSHRNALERVGKAFAEGQPLTVLIGEDKSGATFIIDSLLDAIEGDVAVARITEPCHNAIAGIRNIVHAFGFDSNNMDRADLEDVFRMHLSMQKKQGRRTIICFDESNGDGRWLLDEVLRLVDLETDGNFGLMVILSGGPSLDEHLSKPPLNALPKNASLRFALAPYTFAETKEYIRWRTESLGDAYSGPEFGIDAITLMHELTAGVPDRLGNLCNKCLQLAEEEGTKVTARTVKDATEPHKRRPTRQPPDANAAPVDVNGAGHKGRRLIVRMHGRVVQEQALDREHFLIGRHGECDIRLAYAPVSRRHARIVITSRGVVLSDLGSRNGTYVNGRRIKQHVLRDKDYIEIGECKLEYVAGDKGVA